MSAPSSSARIGSSSLSAKSKSKLRALATALDVGDDSVSAASSPSHLPEMNPLEEGFKTPTKQRVLQSPVDAVPARPSSAPARDMSQSYDVDNRDSVVQIHEHHPAPFSMLPARAPPAAGGHIPSHAKRSKSGRPGRHIVESSLVERHEAQEGGAVKAAFVEAGAHLWLAEELRACASLLSDGAADPREAADRVSTLAQTLQAEAARQRWETGAGAYGGPVDLVNKAASTMHRAAQCRFAAHAIEEYAVALRHGGARGWVTVFGEGGVEAMQPTLIPTLLALADAETALARAKARPSRPGAKDYAHAPLTFPTPTTPSGPRASGRPPTGTAVPTPYGRVAQQASLHARRRLASAGEDLIRDASLVPDSTGLHSSEAPDRATIAAKVLAGGAAATGGVSGFRWRTTGQGQRGMGRVHADLWGSTIHPQHGGTWLGSGWRWRPNNEDSSDEDEEEEARLRERASAARKAVRAANRLYNLWEPENGVCIKCVERGCGQHPTLLAR